MNVGYATLTIIPSAKGFSTSLSKQTDAAMVAAGKSGGEKMGSGLTSSLSSSLKGIGGLAAGLFAADKVKDFFSSAIDEAREAQRASALTTQVIKSTGGAANVSAGQVSNLANAISRKVGIDDEAIQSGANLLLTFTNIRNEAGRGNDVFNQTTQAVVDMSAQVGNMQSNAIQLGKALNDPVKGVTALQRVGVSFTQQQRDQIKALVDSGNTLKAQKLILAEVNKEFGGAAASQATAGDKLQVVWKNFQEQIGTALLPVLDGLENFLSGKLLPALSGIAGVVTPIIGDFFNLATSVPTPVLEGLVAVLALVGAGMLATKVATLAQAGASAIYATATNVVSVATKGWSLAQAALNLVMEANPFALLATLLVALGAALVVAYNKSQTFRDVVSGAFGAVKAVGEALWHGLSAAFDAIKSAISAAAGFVRSHLGLLGAAFGPVGLAVTQLATHWSAVWGGIKAVTGSIVSALKSAFSSLASGVSAAWRGVSGAVKSGINDVIGAVNFFIRAIDAVQIHIPSVGVGPVHTPSFNWDGLGISQIPMLAQGGIATAATLALIGEGSEPEAVLPLSKLAAMLPRQQQAPTGPNAPMTRADAKALVAAIDGLGDRLLDSGLTPLKSEIRRQTDRHVLLTRTGAIGPR